MKCIKKHGEIKRVPDIQAEKLVGEDEWEYCSKSEWKEKVRDKK